MNQNEGGNKNMSSLFIFESKNQILITHEIKIWIKVYRKQGTKVGPFFGYSEPCQF